MQHRLYSLCVLIFIAFGLFSCEKDELTKPVKVNFQFKLDRVAPAESTLLFNEGSMDIQSITFTGDRDTGEDVTFMSDFESVVMADLTTGLADPPVSFDVPQGTYKSIRLLIDPDDIDPDIVVHGEYKPLIGLPIPVQLNMELGGALNLIATSPEGNTQITLRKDSPVTIEIYLNPGKWVTALPATLLETADLQIVGGKPSMVISKKANADIYTKFAALAEGSAEAVVR